MLLPFLSSLGHLSLMDWFELSLPAQTINFSPRERKPI